jgi:hypothetical protein
MKTIEELKNRKVPIVTIDPSLEQFRGKVLFPKKLEKANQMLKTAKLPEKKHLR